MLHLYTYASYCKIKSSTVFKNVFLNPDYDRSRPLLRPKSEGAHTFMTRAQLKVLPFHGDDALYNYGGKK